MTMHHGRCHWSCALYQVYLHTYIHLLLLPERALVGMLMQKRPLLWHETNYGPLTKPGSDCLDRIGSDRIGLRIGLVSSLLVQKNYFDKSCFNNDTGGSE